MRGIECRLAQQLMQGDRMSVGTAIGRERDREGEERATIKSHPEQFSCYATWSHKNADSLDLVGSQGLSCQDQRGARGGCACTHTDVPPRQ
jgi:hypothetical protein